MHLDAALVVSKAFLRMLQFNTMRKELAALNARLDKVELTFGQIYGGSDDAY